MGGEIPTVHFGKGTYLFIETAPAHMIHHHYHHHHHHPSSIIHVRTVSIHINLI